MGWLTRGHASVMQVRDDAGARRGAVLDYDGPVQEIGRIQKSFVALSFVRS
jgi:hypothetical protein